MPNLHYFLVGREHQSFWLVKQDRLDWWVVVVVLDVVRSRRSKVKEQNLTRRGANCEVESIFVSKSCDLWNKVDIPGTRGEKVKGEKSSFFRWWEIPVREFDSNSSQAEFSHSGMGTGIPTFHSPLSTTKTRRMSCNQHQMLEAVYNIYSQPPQCQQQAADALNSTDRHCNHCGRNMPLSFLSMSIR